MVPSMSPEVRKVMYQVFLWANVFLLCLVAGFTAVTMTVPAAVVVVQTVLNVFGVSVGFTAKENVTVGGDQGDVADTVGED